jgi:hypothetical protein
MKLRHKLTIAACLYLFAIGVPVVMLDAWLDSRKGGEVVLWKADTCEQDWLCILEQEHNRKG